jgi:hypothetical protein
MPASENRCRFLHLQGGNTWKARLDFRRVLRGALRTEDRVVVRMPVRMSVHHSDCMLSRMVVRTVVGTLVRFLRALERREMGLRGSDPAGVFARALGSLARKNPQTHFFDRKSAAVSLWP